MARSASCQEKSPGANEVAVPVVPVVPAVLVVSAGDVLKVAAVSRALSRFAAMGASLIAAVLLQL